MREIVFDKDSFIVSKTDKSGKIIYGNKLFIELTGYSKNELLGSPHNIVRHEDMPRGVFKILWDTLQKGREINAFVKNKSKDGSFYWVFANATPSYNGQGEIIGYHSIRRFPNREGVNSIWPVYQKMLEIEKTNGIDSSIKFLLDKLKEFGVTYERFIISLQN